MREIFGPWGVELTLVDMTDLAAIKSAVRKNTRAIWVETPSNPLLRVTDIAAVSLIARAPESPAHFGRTRERRRFDRRLGGGAEVSNAVVLLSGGLDSTTMLSIARREHDVYALSFRYGQRHTHELDAATRVAARGNVKRHVIMDIDLRTFGGSALTADIDVPKDRAPSVMANAIPITYVPARNTIFLAFALAYAEVISARDIYIGVNAVDYSGYPDCRPEYIEAFERMANLATRGGVDGTNPVTIRAPLLHLSKADIIKTGIRLGVDYADTSSCYDPASDGRACGRCDACQLRRTGFADAGVPDPTRYA
jgi:7-cyano-7-deazaguanine synthase